MESMLSKLSKAGTSPQGLGKLSKDMEQFVKNTDKFGKSMDSSFKKLSQNIREIASTHLTQLQTKIEQMGTKAERRITKLREMEKQYDQMKSSGASQEELSKYSRKMNRVAAVSAGSNQRLTEYMDEYQGLESTLKRPGLAQRMRPYGAVAASLAQAVATGAGYYQSALTAENQNTAYLGGQLQQRRIAAYRGDLTEQVMQAKDQSFTKARAFARKQTNAEDVKQVGSSIAGGLGIGAGAAFGAGVLGIAAAPVALGIGAVAGLGYAGSKLYNYFGQGGKETFEKSQEQSFIEAEKRRNMTAYYTQRFQETAGDRFNFQRQMEMGSEAALQMRQSGYANYVSAGQMQQASLNFRQRFGNNPSLAIQSAQLSGSQGMDFGTAQAMIGQAAVSGTGGQAKTKESITEMYSQAFSRGLTDSGLIELLQKAVLGQSSTSAGQVNLSTQMARMVKDVMDASGGATPSARQIEGVMQAEQYRESLTSQGGEGGYVDMSDLSRLTGGNYKAMAYLKQRSALERENIGNDPVFKSMFGDDLAGKVGEYYGTNQNMLRRLQVTALGKSEIGKAKKLVESGDMQGAIDILGGASGLVSGQKFSPEAARTVGENLAEQIFPEQYQGFSKNRAQATYANQRNTQIGAIAPLLGKKNLSPGEIESLATNFAALQQGVNPDAAMQTEELQGETGLLKTLEANNPEAAKKVRQSIQDIINKRAGTGIAGSSSKEGQAVGAQMAGAGREDTDIQRGAGDFIGQARAGQFAASGVGLNGSVESLKSALDNFVREVERTSGSSSYSTGTGGNQ